MMGDCRNPDILLANGERFFSRRNIVSRISIPQGHCILKVYNNAQAWAQEMQQLRQLRNAGIRVPCVLGSGDNYLLIEYLDGPTYLELFEHMEQRQEAHIKAVEALIEWLYAYHGATGMLRGDVNLRNFLFYDDKCYGIDFEEAMQQGEIETDIGNILAFILTYHPSFTKYKIDLARKVLIKCKSLGAKEEKIRCAYVKEIDAMHQRRSKNSKNV